MAGLADVCDKDDQDKACEGQEDLAQCRAFTGSIGKTIRSINEYGCWCYFGNDHGRGKGQPQDAIDEMCKVLADGYDCAMRDAEDEGTTCVPWEVEYVSAIGGSDVGIAKHEEICLVFHVETLQVLLG